MEEIPESRYQEVYSGYEQASKMLLAMYRSMNVVDSDK
jgi:hypothetical protein